MEVLERIVELANGLVPWLQFTGATTGPAPGERVAMLDAQMSIEHTPGGEVIQYQFFEKACASRLVLMYQSAMPIKQKIQTLANEIIR